MKDSMQSISNLYVQDQTRMQTLNSPQYCFMNRVNESDQSKVDELVTIKVDDQLDLRKERINQIDY